MIADRIWTALAALTLLLAAMGEGSAWDRTFHDTRDHLRATCAVVSGEIVETPTETSCFSHKSGASVVCGEAGLCEGAGPGRFPGGGLITGRADVATILGIASWQ